MRWRGRGRAGTDGCWVRACGGCWDGGGEGEGVTLSGASPGAAAVRVDTEARAAAGGGGGEGEGVALGGALPGAAPEEGGTDAGAAAGGGGAADAAGAVDRGRACAVARFRVCAASGCAVVVARR